jgi:hypothetical protein
MSWWRRLVTTDHHPVDLAAERARIRAVAARLLALVSEINRLADRLERLDLERPDEHP